MKNKLALGTLIPIPTMCILAHLWWSLSGAKSRTACIFVDLSFTFDSQLLPVGHLSFCWYNCLKSGMSFFSKSFQYLVLGNHGFRLIFPIKFNSTKFFSLFYTCIFSLVLKILISANINIFSGFIYNIKITSSHNTYFITKNKNSEWSSRFLCSYFHSRNISYWGCTENCSKV